MLDGPSAEAKSLSQESFLSRRSPHHSTLRLNSLPYDSEIAISEIKTLRTRADIGFWQAVLCHSWGGRRSPLAVPDFAGSPQASPLDPADDCDGLGDVRGGCG